MPDKCTGNCACCKQEVTTVEELRQGLLDQVEAIKSLIAATAIKAEEGTEAFLDRVKAAIHNC